MQKVKVIKEFPYTGNVVVHWEDKQYQPYVVAWKMVIQNEEGKEEKLPARCFEGDVVTCYWGQGHYFGTEEAALEYARQEEISLIQDKIDWLMYDRDRLIEEGKSTKVMNKVKEV